MISVSKAFGSNAIRTENQDELGLVSYILTDKTGTIT
jgi:magnesium-transporting ATPase (P-type)